MGEAVLRWECPNGDGIAPARICWLCKAECEPVVGVDPAGLPRREGDDGGG